MTHPVPPYWKPPRSKYARYVLPAIIVAVVVVVIAAGLVIETRDQAPVPACQNTGTWQ